MWLCSRRSALTTCKTSNIPNTFVTRKQQGAGCPRTQRSRPRPPPLPTHLYRSSLEARAASSKAFDTVGGGLFWRLSSRRSTHAVRPA